MNACDYYPLAPLFVTTLLPLLIIRSAQAVHMLCFHRHLPIQPVVSTANQSMIVQGDKSQDAV